MRALALLLLGALVGLVAMDISIRYDAPPTLSRFMDSDAFVRVVVGPVGSGKSSACIMEILRRAAEQRPMADGVRRTRWAVIRNTRPQLQDTTRKTFEQWVPEELGEWNESEFTFTLRFPLEDGTKVESEVLFRALDRPRDVRKALSLDLTGAYINEVREVPKEVFDGLQGRCGRYPKMDDGGPTWYGLWGDTNPWHTAHWGYRLFTKAKPKDFELFEQPGGRTPEAENVSNLVPGYYERLTHGKDAEWVDEYVDGKYPSADRGSIYGHLLAALEARGGVADFQHPTDGVFACLDLGISDSTAIWWWRLNSTGVDFVDHYEAHGEPLSHFFDELDKRPYQLVKIWLPHDARARTLATGSSIQDQFLAKYTSAKVAIGPQLSLLDGLQATRWLLEQPGTRFHSRCKASNGPSDVDGVEALRAYRYEYDEERKVYTKRPLHDWASHTADAARYTAVVVKVSELLTRKELPKPPKPLPSLAEAFKLEDLYAARKPRGGGRI